MYSRAPIEDDARTLEREILRESQRLLHRGALATVHGRCDEHDPLDDVGMPCRDLDRDLRAHRVADRRRRVRARRLRRNAATRSAVRSIVSTRCGSGASPYPGRSIAIVCAAPRRRRRPQPRRLGEVRDEIGEDAAAHADAVDHDVRGRPGRGRTGALGDESRTRMRERRDVAHPSRLAANAVSPVDGLPSTPAPASDRPASVGSRCLTPPPRSACARRVGDRPARRLPLGAPADDRHRADLAAAVAGLLGVRRGRGHHDPRPVEGERRAALDRVGARRGIDRAAAHRLGLRPDLRSRARADGAAGRPALAARSVHRGAVALHGDEPAVRRSRSARSCS